MTLLQLWNTTYTWLREPEYLNTTPGLAPVPPANAQFPLTQLTSDLNNALQIFLERCGFSPDLSDKMATLPVTATLDFLLPADLGALTRVEYYGQSQDYPEVLIARSFADFDEITGGGEELTASGTPQFYRQPYGEQGSQTIRLYPAPELGNVNPGTGTVEVVGNPVLGDQASIIMQPAPGGPVTKIGPYLVQTGDTAASVAAALVSLFNQNATVLTYCAPATTDGLGNITLTSLFGIPAGDQVQYQGGFTSPDMDFQVLPLAVQSFTGAGVNDNIILYYSSTGNTLAIATDVPNIPSEFHEALVCYVLKRYWRIKNDLAQAKAYGDDFEQHVKYAKMLVDDLNQTGAAGSTAQEEDYGDSALFGTV